MPNAPGADDNDEDIEDVTVIDHADSLTSVIDPLQDEILEIEGVDAGDEGVDVETEGVENVGRVTINANVLHPEQKDIAYGTLPTSTTTMKELINAPWDGAT